MLHCELLSKYTVCTNVHAEIYYMHACVLICKWQQFPVCQKHITKTTTKDKKQPPSSLHLCTHTYIWAHTLTYTHTYSVGKKQWCIPAHISPAGDNCAISQRVAETLFIACCGGMGGGYELMSSERKTTSSHTLIQIPHEYTHTHIHAYKHTERQHSPISGLSLFSR